MSKKTVVKVMVHTGVWFDTDKVDVRKRKDEEGNTFEERTVITKKYPFRAVVRGVDEGTALRLEEAGLVAILGPDEDESEKAPVAVSKPNAPKAKGPAPSVDDLTT